MSYAGLWVTARSGGDLLWHVGDLDAVVACDALDEFGQLIFPRFDENGFGLRGRGELFHASG